MSPSMQKKALIERNKANISSVSGDVRLLQETLNEAKKAKEKEEEMERSANKRRGEQKDKDEEGWEKQDAGMVSVSKDGKSAMIKSASPPPTSKFVHPPPSHAPMHSSYGGDVEGDMDVHVHDEEMSPELIRDLSSRGGKRHNSEAMDVSVSHEFRPETPNDPTPLLTSGKAPSLQASG